jgi:hypothetical protein
MGLDPLTGRVPTLSSDPLKQVTQRRFWLFKPFDIAGENLASGGDEQELVGLQDLLDEVINGRTDGHRCPWCRSASVECGVNEGMVRIECPDCRKTFDGRLA